MIAAKRAEAEDGALDKFGPRRMLNEKQVLEIVPVGRSTLYRMEKAGRFPTSQQEADKFVAEVYACLAMIV